MGFKSLRINIILNIGILLLLGMLIIDFVIISFSKNELVKNRINQIDVMSFQARNVLGSADREGIHDYLLRLVNKTDDCSVFWSGMGGYDFIIQPDDFDRIKRDLSPGFLNMRVRQVIKSKATDLFFSGTTWAGFWPDKKYLIVSYPVDGESGLCFIVPLKSIYDVVMKQQKLVFFYMVFNTVLLCLVAFVRFQKIVIRPIQKLTDIIKGYDGQEDALYRLYPENSEIGHLSTSLNSMVNRISDDKKKLETSLDELKKAQTEVIRAEKMSSIGRLSAGVAHEIGNPIGIVLGYLALLKQENLSKQDKMDFLDRSEKEIKRIDTIIKQLLNLSRRSRVEYSLNPVHEIIKDTVGIIKNQPMFSRIDVDMEFGAGDDVVKSDKDQLKQVLINLLMNAGDAVASCGGDIGFIRIKTGEISDVYQRYLEIRIIDNGCGISPDTEDRIFDPFYTTKEPGAGTGLGLWVSYMIIEEINGTMRAQNRETGGTEFIIVLPLAQGLIQKREKS